MCSLAQKIPTVYHPMATHAKAPKVVYPLLDLLARKRILDLDDPSLLHAKVSTVPDVTLLFIASEH